MATTVPYRQTFFRLLGFLRPYRVSLIVSIVLAVGSQAAAIVIAYLTGSGLENAITANSHSELYGIAVAVILVGAFRALFMAGRRLISGRQALAVEYDMRNALYAKLLRLSFRFYDQHQTGQLLSRATVDLQTVRFFLGYGLVFLLQSAITIVIAGVVMVALEPGLALVALAPTPFVVWIAYRYAKTTIRGVTAVATSASSQLTKNMITVAPTIVSTFWKKKTSP